MAQWIWKKLAKKDVLEIQTPKVESYCNNQVAINIGNDCVHHDTECRN